MNPLFPKTKLIPKTKSELKDMIEQCIAEDGQNCSLNDIDTSLITDMSGIFYSSHFDGDISEWNTSNVTNMKNMFEYSWFNGHIKAWNTSCVKNMSHMFDMSHFNRNIEQWDVSAVEDSSYMFYKNYYNHPLKDWKLRSINKSEHMFESGTPMPIWYSENVTDIQKIMLAEKLQESLSSDKINVNKHKI